MNKRFLVTAPILAATLLLGGCSSGNGSDAEQPTNAPTTSSSSESPQQTQVPEPAEAAAPAATVDAVVAALGITDFAAGETAPFTTSYGSGTFEGTRAQIYEFPDEDAFNSFVEMVSSMGITADSFARSGMIAVSVDDSTKLETVRALIS